jgi:Zn-dependent protease
MSGLDAVFSVRNIQLAVINLVALILSICVHEFGHAFVADKLGDPLPRSQGRVTLNPLAHIDPIGTIAFPLAAFFLAAAGSSLASMMLGWGKPVQVSLSARHMTRKLRIKHSHLLIALAGPTMNVLFGLLLSGVFIGLIRGGMAPMSLEGVPLLPYSVLQVVALNIGLALFNLIPCPPLDGGAVLAGILPDGNRVVGFLNRYGSMLFFALLFTGLLGYLMKPASWVSGWWMQVISGWAGL